MTLRSTEARPCDRFLLSRSRGPRPVSCAIAFSKYLLVGEKIIIEHPEVPVELEGKGIAGRIVRTALDCACAQKLKVMPLCPFIAGFIHRHPEYQDLVLDGSRY